MAIIKVDNLKVVDAKKYSEGDIFITKNSAALLFNGKVKPFIFEKGISKAEVNKMIDEKIKEVK